MLELADILPNVVILTAFLEKTYYMPTPFSRRGGLGYVGCHIFWLLWKSKILANLALHACRPLDTLSKKGMKRVGYILSI